LRFNKSSTLRIVLALLFVVSALVAVLKYQDPMLHTNDPLELVALRIERAVPWVDVVSVQVDGTSAAIFIDMTAFYTDPASYNLYAVSQAVYTYLSPYITEDVTEMFIGHMSYSVKERKFEILQPFFLSGYQFLQSGWFYPGYGRYWWQDGWLATSEYIYLGNPYTNPLVRLAGMLPPRK
jgi:hypothetical protein